VPARAYGDRRSFRNEDLVLRVSANVDPAVWDETRYEGFLDRLCGTREYQKDAIRSTLRYVLGRQYASLRELAKENFESNEEIQQRYGSWAGMERHLQLPGKLSCSVDQATGTGKSYVLYGIGMILLAEGAVDRVLVLCPSNTIEAGLLEKFKELAGDSDSRDALPSDAKLRTPHVIRADESIVDGAICVENYHAILENVKSSIRESLSGKGARVAVLNDEAHHVANAPTGEVGKWKEFLLDPAFEFRIIIGVSGTCYVKDEYFADVVHRFSLREAIEQRWVKKVEYVAEMPTTDKPDDKWQLIYNRHERWRQDLQKRGIRPLTIIVTKDIRGCVTVAEELQGWLQERERLTEEESEAKVLPVSSHKNHQPNIARLRLVDNASSKVEWIVSVSMLSEGWDVKNVFQIVPHEERAFDSKLLIAQVLGRGLRRPTGWQGEDPIVTVFNHDAWSSRIKHLVNEILEIEHRLTSTILIGSPYHFTLHQLDYTRNPASSEHEKKGEYRFLEQGFVDLPSQVVAQEVSVVFERAVTADQHKFTSTINYKTFSVEEVAERMFRAFEAIDIESASETDPKNRTNYRERFPLEKCVAIVRSSLKRAGIKGDRITDDNRQKFLQALGPLRRKSAKRVVYQLSPEALVTIETSERQADSCSAGELRRGSKTVFYTPGSEAMLVDEQREFFRQVADEDGEFSAGRAPVGNSADFKTPTNLVIADGTPERKFVRELTTRANAQALDAWLKNTHIGFYSVEYAWKKGDHPKRGLSSPDFFLKQGDRIFVVEIKGDDEIAEPSIENVKKHEYARQHFSRLNDWLEREGIDARYQFNMLTPKDYLKFFTMCRGRDLVGFRSELDIAIMKLGKAADREQLV
jgi:type III restriction enzyme